MLSLPFEGRQFPVRGGALTDRFVPYEVHTYQWDQTPQLPTPG
jgi:hypothetical protein